MGATPGSFWLTPHDIYVQLTTGPGSGSIDTAQQALNAIWKDEEERATRTRLQGVLIQSAWQGPASDAAYGAAEPLAQVSLSGADLLYQAQDLVDRQSGSFNRAKNDVRPVPEKPPVPDITDMSWPFTDYEKKMSDYQSDAQHNIAVFSDYDGASDYNETRLPMEYSTPTHSSAGISVVPDGSQGGDKITVPDQGPPPGGGHPRPAGGGDPRPGGGSEPQPFGGGPGTGNPPAGPQPRQTSPSDFVPGPPGGPGPGGFQRVPGGSGPGGGTPGLPVAGFAPGGPLGGGGGPGGRPGGGPGGGGPRGGAYGPGRGPGAGVGGPGVTGRGPGGGPGGGFGPGAGAGALAAEQAAAQRAAAAAAGRGTGSGAMGGAPMGGGRGKGDEDEEHKRKVLIEADAEGVFGSDVLTAPQVIGDDEYEDD